MKNTKRYLQFGILVLAAATLSVSACRQVGGSAESRDSDSAGTGGDSSSDAEADTGGDTNTDTDLCAAGQRYYEPGCSSEMGMPIVEIGCYSPCEGVHCETGICQLTDVNPCVCRPGTECCTDCGEHEWLCLDAPETCGYVIEDPLIISARQHLEKYDPYGEAYIRIEPSDEETCMTVEFLACYWDLNAFCTDPMHGTLTAAGQARATGLGAELTGIDLGEEYGCSYCEGNYPSQLTVRTGGNRKEIIYEWRNPPNEIARADAFTQRLVHAFVTCTSNDDIIIDSSYCSATLEQ